MVHLSLSIRSRRVYPNINRVIESSRDSYRPSLSGAKGEPAVTKADSIGIGAVYRRAEGSLYFIYFVGCCRQSCLCVLVDGHEHEHEHEHEH